MKKKLLLKRMKSSFFITILMLLFSWQANAHVTEIRVNQNQDGTLTWYLQTYHRVNSCGHGNAGLTINGVNYNISSEHSGSIVGLSPTVFAVNSWISSRSSYAIVQTPYIAGNLNVRPYSNNVCWAFLVGGNGSFTPPPPPVCTTPPINTWTNTVGAINKNGTDCDPTDDTLPVTLKVNHQSCGSITNSGTFSVYLAATNTLLGNFAYSTGINTNATINLPYGFDANTAIKVVDDSFGAGPVTHTLAGLSGTFNGHTDLTGCNEPPVAKAKNITVNVDENCAVTILNNAIDDGSSDPDGDVLTYSLSTNGPFTVGTYNVTMTVTDPSNESDSANAIVTVVDNIAPTVITKDISISLVNGGASITAESINDGTFDNCNLALSIDRDSFSCSDIGDHTVTLTATDASGNTSTNTATVTIVGSVPAVTISGFTAVQSQQANTIYLGYGPQSMNLTANATGGDSFTYQWSASTGEMIDAVANPTVSPTVSTTYTVTTTNNFGCSTTATIEVCVIDARSFNKKGKATGKVIICHHTNGKKGTKHVELNISSNAVGSHLTNHGADTSHGDRLGGCEAICISGTTTPRLSINVEINDLDLAVGTVVYPNPTKGAFNVKLNNFKGATELYLFNITGKMVEKTSIKDDNLSGNIQMNKNNLPNGVYLLKIISKEKTTTKKIIIKRQ